MTWIAVGIFAAGVVMDGMGSRKQRKADEKARQERSRAIGVAGNESRVSLAYENSLNQWKERKVKAARAKGAQNWAEFGRQGPAHPQMPNTSRYLNMRPEVVPQDPGAVPEAPGPTEPYQQNIRG